ncbi:S-adenosyl-L-methionine-dependent methyltransferase [Cladochytrium replicatum]|nr:S-adenosyl-L-methionine-dependent methyltransferase [Cladochytrium replicatum]
MEPSALIKTQAAAEWAPGEDQSGADERTYHGVKSVPYTLPNDASESSRLNAQHKVIRAIFDYPSPAEYLSEEVLENGAKVLDVGTGTGAWIADAIREHPRGEYIGFDITSKLWVEPTGRNVTLVEGNVMEKLPFEDNTFDLVHQQMLFLGAPETAWPSIFEEYFRVLKPGGVLYIIEMHAVAKHQGQITHHAKQFAQTTQSMFAARGVNIQVACKIGEVVEQNGQFDILPGTESRNISWNLEGPLGDLWRWNIHSVLETTGGFASVAMGIHANQWSAFLADVEAGFKASNAYHEFYRVCARKRV